MIAKPSRSNNHNSFTEIFFHHSNRFNKIGIVGYHIGNIKFIVAGIINKVRGKINISSFFFKGVYRHFLPFDVPLALFCQVQSGLLCPAHVPRFFYV